MTRCGLFDLLFEEPHNRPEEMPLTGQEPVELDEQLQVDVVALWRLAVRAANMVCVEIDTC